MLAGSLFQFLYGLPMCDKVLINPVVKEENLLLPELNA